MRSPSLLLCCSFCFLQLNSSVSQTGWFEQSSNVDLPFSKIYFIDENIGWAATSGGYTFVTGGHFIRTINGGTNWQTVLHGDVGYSSFCFVNHYTGWLIGNYWDDMGGRGRFIFKTTNGGYNWTTQFHDSSNQSVNSVHFIDQSNGWVVGKYNIGYVLKTTDSGNNWISYNISNAGILKSVVFINQSTGWAVGGYDSIIFKTTNSGINWNLQFSYLSRILSSVYFLNQNTGWACGSYGMILKTSNSGVNWVVQNSGISNYLNSIYFINESRGWCCGNDGKILYTTNGGNSWQAQLCSTTHNLNSIFFINPTTGWAAGGYSSITSIGTILKTTTGGVIAVKPLGEKIPVAYALRQNYPNPFNPVTKIRFDIPTASLSSIGVEPGVRLIIYNVLGKEISTLVNEQLQPGSYEVDWDASSYPSDVYFYRLTAGKYTETKKMVLIR